MEKKRLGIFTVIVTMFACGLPGLAGSCFGLLALAGAVIPGGGIPAEDSGLVAGVSIMILGLSMVFIAIPIGTGIWTWWAQKKEAANMARLIIPEEDF